MNRIALLALIPLVGCSDDKPPKQDTLAAFNVAMTMLTKVQSKAVTSAQTVAPAVNLSIDYNMPCTLGGTAAMRGDYEGNQNDANAEFDLKATFDACAEMDGTLDGTLRWTSVASGTAFSGKLVGSIDFTSPSASASCDVDIEMMVTQSSISYRGKICGYNLGELGVSQ